VIAPRFQTQPVNFCSLIDRFSPIRVGLTAIMAFCTDCGGLQVDDTGITVIVLLLRQAHKCIELALRPTAVQPIGERVHGSAMTDETM